MYLYGGVRPDGDNNEKLYAFDSLSHTWTKTAKRGVQPSSRDQHTANAWEDKMIVFGGFEDMIRVNTMQVYNFEDTRWSFPENEITEPVPEARGGHSSVIHKNKMYIFGGTNRDNVRIQDTWIYDLVNMMWEQVNTK